MSEFRRMITYLYLYERGVKSRNIGFAKIEKRDLRCLVEIHMKNTGCSLSPIPVYFFVQKKEHLVGIPLGNCTLSRGIGEFKTMLQADNLKDSGYALDAVKGIYIPLTERIMLVSQWDDDEFHQEAFVPLKELATLEKSDSGSSDSSANHSQTEPAAANAPDSNLQPATEFSSATAVLPTANTENKSVSQLPGMSTGSSPNKPVAPLSPKTAGNASNQTLSQSPGKMMGNNPNQMVSQSPGKIMDSNPNQMVSQPPGKMMDSNPNQMVSQSPGKMMDSNPNQTLLQPSAKPMGKQQRPSISQSFGQRTNNQPESVASQASEKPTNNQPGDAPSTVNIPTETEAQNNASPIHEQNTDSDDSNTSLRSDVSSPLSQPKTDNRLNAAETPPPKAMDVLKALEAMPRSVQKMTNFRAINGNSQATKNTSAIHNTQSSEKSQSGRQTQSSPEKQTESVEDWSLRWRFILENFPVMTPFSGDDNTLCVRMELKDLRQLPRQFWYLGNNSFLLHGFFNYRYLILGMTETLGMKRWFIGVPGVFQNPERVMAALFGFPEFRSEKTSPINTGEFGYWYRYLNELTQMPGNNNS